MAPRPAPLRWGPALSADAVVAAALRVARADGIGAVSMRRVAEELDVSAMALYRHVADRDDLLLRMLDVVADGVGPPPDGGLPRQRLAAIMERMRAAFAADPWVVQVIATQGLASPRILPTVEAMFAALADAGLRPTQARSAYLLLFQFAYGEALVTQHSRPDSYAQRMVRDLDTARFPRLAEVARHPTGDDAFTVNLGRVLDGILTMPQS